MNKMPVIALIVAAGSGQRYSSSFFHSNKSSALQDNEKIEYLPKQYQILCEKRGLTILGMSITSFLINNLIDVVAVVINEDHRAYYADTIGNLKGIHGSIVDTKLQPVISLASQDIPRRQDSVRLGLFHLKSNFPDCSKVLIHDGARPLVSQGIINRVIDALKRGTDVVDVGVSLSDSLRCKNKLSRLNRDDYYAVQTPQAFILKDILEWHKKYASFDVTDDLAFLSFLEDKVDYVVVNGEVNNIKVTTYNDFLLAKIIIKRGYFDDFAKNK